MSNHAKVYTEADLVLFARYVAARADLRPKGCTGAEMCWVEKGPPALGKDVCLGCKMSPVDKRRGCQPERPPPRFAW